MFRAYLAGCAALALVACGRFGIELLPLPASDAGVRDAATPDANTGSDANIPAEAGMNEGGTAGDSGGPPTDAGPEDAGMPDACPTVCENPNGTASCQTGSCVTTCETGYADCDGTPTNGCESNISSQAPTCGSCTNVCTNTNGTAECSAGLCTPMCSTGFSDCDMNAANGCETNLNTVADCGACGMPCSNPNGTTSCSTGTCMPACNAGFADCDGDPKNGCETNTDVNPLHCGSCGGACGNPNLICVDGGCELSPCATGRGECDGDLGVACETDLTNTVNHCGFCGNVCTTANGTPGCTASACRVSSCNTGYANCDNAVPNGCEVNTRTSTANCGGCGMACTNAHGTTSCAASVCVPSCSTGYGDCDSSRPNGCETALNTTSNCGMCGRVCPAVTGGTPVCSAGICSASCNLTGTYALKITLDTSWSQNSNITSGRGNHVFWLRMTGTQSGSTVSASLLECGRRVPPFDARAVNETFLFEVPNSVFDRSPAILPTSSATITLGNTSPTASVNMPLTAFLIGTSMANPVTATWPSAASGLTRVDMDNNTDPGVTVAYVSGSGYTFPRVGGSLFDDRSSNPYVATRLVFSLQGNLTSCTGASGAATVTQINTRIFGCKIANSTSKCTTSEGNFLDQNCLVYSPGAATYQMVKINDGSSCADVRNRLP